MSGFTVKTQGTALEGTQQKHMGAIFREGDPTPWANWNAVSEIGGGSWDWEIWRHSTRIAYGNTKQRRNLEEVMVAGVEFFLFRAP